MAFAEVRQPTSDNPSMGGAHGAEPVATRYWFERMVSTLPSSEVIFSSGSSVVPVNVASP